MEQAQCVTSASSFSHYVSSSDDKTKGVCDKTKAMSKRKSDILDVFWIGERRTIPSEEGLFWIEGWHVWREGCRC